MRTAPAALATLLAVLSMGGCGGRPDCSTYSVMSVGPITASANHSAKAPANSAQFQAGITQQLVHPSSSCALPALAVAAEPNWTVSDPGKATISSAKDLTNGLATCLASSSSPITVTATQPSNPAALTATATLNCE
jgi:hypothetical protein